MQDIHSILSELPTLLLPWYEQNARTLPWRETKDPYPIWISEIMLQQTRVDAVKAYYTRFLTALPTIAALADVSRDALFKLWEGLGYYRRADNLQKAAKEIMTQWHGVFPSSHAEILSLPGIGAYTAGAIGSICFSLPTPAVDGNVLRVIARVLSMEDNIDIDATKKKVTQWLSAVMPLEHPGTFNQALMELGAMLCIPNGSPYCTQCPLASICTARAGNTMLSFPVRNKKCPRKQIKMTVLVLLHKNKLALQKRASTGLLAGMWQFPNQESICDETQAIQFAETLGVSPQDLLCSGERTHIFTHVEWHMTCYHIDCKYAAPNLQWFSPEELDSQVALPTAFRQCLLGRIL